MKNLYIPLYFFPVLLANCSKKTAIDTTNSYLPNTVGTNYTYAVTDSNNNKTYSVYIAIVGRSTLPNGTPVSIWTITNPASVNTNYVYSDKDSAIFYDRTKMYIANVYRFPLAVGARWSIPYKSDTLTVVNNYPLKTTIGTFNNTFLLQEHGAAENYHFNKSQWFVPKVGMVKMYYQEFYFGSPVTQYWDLINYHIN